MFFDGPFRLLSWLLFLVRFLQETFKVSVYDEWHLRLVAKVFELHDVALVTILIFIYFRHRNATFVDLSAIYHMGFQLCRGVVAVKTPFTEVHPTIVLRVLFAHKSGEILNPDVMVRDGVQIIIIFRNWCHDIDVGVLGLDKEQVDMVLLLRLCVMTRYDLELLSPFSSISLNSSMYTFTEIVAFIFSNL